MFASTQECVLRLCYKITRILRVWIIDVINFCVLNGTQIAHKKGYA